MADLHRFQFDRFHHIAITDLPAALADRFKGLAYTTTATAATDLRVLVALDLPSMQAQLEAVAADHLLTADGYVYLLYPKLASKHYPGIHRDDLFRYLHLNDATGEVAHTGLKFSRMRSFDADFTLVDLRWLAQAPRPKHASSQRVADYDARVPELRERLQHRTPALVAAFERLTAYMQRDWARYIFSPKRPVTQNSHFDQMCLVLAAGFRTLAEYKAGR